MIGNGKETGKVKEWPQKVTFCRINDTFPNFLWHVFHRNSCKISKIGVKFTTIIILLIRLAIRPNNVI